MRPTLTATRVDNGDGTGLGLALSFGIVKNHPGRFEVESCVSHGTCFRAFLPIRRVAPDASGRVVLEPIF